MLLKRSRYAASCARYIVSRNPKIRTGTSANVTMVGIFVAPAKEINAATRVRHHVLHDELCVARRLMIPWSMFICAITAGFSAGQKFGFDSSATVVPPRNVRDRDSILLHRECRTFATAEQHTVEADLRKDDG